MNEFMTLVEKMRMAQKQYSSSFRGSDEKRKWLLESKRLETEVDAEIARNRQGQMEMFQGGEDA